MNQNKLELIKKIDTVLVKKLYDNTEQIETVDELLTNLADSLPEKLGFYFKIIEVDGIVFNVELYNTPTDFYILDYFIQEGKVFHYEFGVDITISSINPKESEDYFLNQDFGNKFPIDLNIDILLKLKSEKVYQNLINVN